MAYHESTIDSSIIFRELGNVTLGCHFKTSLGHIASKPSRIHLIEWVYVTSDCARNRPTSAWNETSFRYKRRVENTPVRP